MMKAYRSQILRYLNEYEKPRTSREIMEFLMRQRKGKPTALTEQRKQTILCCLKKLEAEKLVYSKKHRNRIYWAGKEEYLAVLDKEEYQVTLKDLLKGAKKTQRPPLKFYRG